MTMNELKTQISFALKDPILQQGFEVLCKENEYLNQKIAHLECEVKNVRKETKKY